MNFLALCQAARREAGISGTGPSAVTGQFGMSDKIVNWVNEAYMEIQGAQPSWRFMWTPFTFNLTAGKGAYDPPVDFGVTVGAWSADEMSLYRVTEGPGSRYWPEYIEWIGLNYMTRTIFQPGLPQFVSERPDRALVFSPTPDTAMVMDAPYYREPEPLVNGDDIPRMPAKYHMMIVWRAVMLYAGQDEAPATFAHAGKQYRQLMNQMLIEETGPMQMPEPLA